MKYNQIQQMFGLPENPNADLENLVGTPVPNAPAVPAISPAPVAAPVVATQAPEVQPEMEQAPQETELQRLERLAQEMSTRKKAEMEEAGKKQLYHDLISGLNSNLGLIVGGAQAMNTKAAVNAPKQAEIAQRDLAGEVDKRYKSDQESLMEKYKALLKAQEEAKDRALKMANQGNDDWYKQAMLEERRADRQLRQNMFERGQDYREEKGNRLSDKQTGDVESIDNALYMVDRIESEKPKFNTGPVKARVQGMLGVVGAEDPEFAAFKARTIDTLSDYVKSKSGLQVTDAERKALEQVVPNASMDDDTFMATLAVFKERLNAIREQKVGSFAKQGKDASNFEKEQTKVVNGVTYKKVPGGWQKVQ